MRCKNPLTKCTVALRGCKMTLAQEDAEFVEHASYWADKLVHWESKGPGDYENARRRLARRIGVPFATLWALRYRKPKFISPAKYKRIGGAFHDLRGKFDEASEKASASFRQALFQSADALESRANALDCEAETADREADALDREADALNRGLKP